MRAEPPHEAALVLANLILTAATRTQIVAVTHSMTLVAALENGLTGNPGQLQPIELVKESSETLVAGQGTLDEPPWHWPKR
jgi:predicted ATPase